MNSLKDFSSDELVEELERREMNIPDEIYFYYYLHDNYTFNEFVDFMEEQTGLAFNDKIIENARAKFYEVKFNCKMDTRTGNVTILGVE